MRPLTMTRDDNLIQTDPQRSWAVYTQFSNCRFGFGFNLKKQTGFSPDLVLYNIHPETQTGTQTVIYTYINSLVYRYTTYNICPHIYLHNQPK